LLAFNGFILSSNAEWSFPKPSTVRGITIGASLSNVLKLLGSPTKRVDNKSKMGIGDTTTLFYNGLKIYLTDGSHSEEKEVTNIIVTGPYKVYPGIKVGMNQGAIVKVLGQPGPQDKDDEGRSIAVYNLKSYFKSESSLVIIFQKEKAVEIEIVSAVGNLE
jgi:hypothetical protein